MFHAFQIRISGAHRCRTPLPLDLVKIGYGIISTALSYAVWGGLYASLTKVIQRRHMMLDDKETTWFCTQRKKKKKEITRWDMRDTGLNTFMLSFQMLSSGWTEDLSVVLRVFNA